MVSLQQPTSGVMQANAIAEIDPGPPILTPHEFAYPLRTSSPQMTESSGAHKRCVPTASQRPAEQQLENTSTGQRRSVGLVCNDTCTDGTGDSHLGTNDLEGGIAFEHPEYPCPSALGFPGAIHEEKAFGTWMMDLRKHLTTDFRCRQFPSLYEGPNNDGTQAQARRQPSPDARKLPSHPRPLRSTGRLGSTIKVGHGEHVPLRTSRPLGLLNRSHYGIVMGSEYRDDLATACTSRAGENACAPKGWQEKGWQEKGLYDCPNVGKEAAYEQNWPRKSAHQELGDTWDGGEPPGMCHLTVGTPKHRPAWLGPDGTSLLNAHGLLKENHDALRMKTFLKEMRSDLSYRDNVTKTDTSGEARVDEDEKSFDVKWEAVMDLSPDNPLIHRSERFVKNIVDTDNPGPTRPQPMLGRVSRKIAPASPTKTSSTSSRALGIREQRSIDSSYSTRFMMLEAKRYVGLPALTSWATGLQTNSSVGAADVPMRDALMWMIAYNMITSPSESESLPRLLDQSAQLLLNLVAAAISCFHVQFSPIIQRTNVRAMQCTGTVHCLLEDPG